MVNGIIDIGNTAIKWAIFDDFQLRKKGVLEKGAWAELSTIHQTHSINEWIISSVAEIPDTETIGFAYYLLKTDSPLPVTNTYKTPSTLGKDRIAAVCGAHALIPNEHVLVIDAGTCITYDFIDQEGVYHGGNICPGIHMRLKAMHAFTGRLPEVNWQNDLDFMGVDTQSSLIRGVNQGVLGEAERFISLYTKRFGPLRIMICGGDLPFFEKNLKMGIFAAPELVPVGLNSILRHKQLLHG